MKFLVPLLSLPVAVYGQLAAAAAAATASSADPAADAPLETVVVNNELQSPVKAEEARLANIPGGASLIAADVFEKGRVGTTSDILAFQPGVFAQTRQPGSATTITARPAGHE